ncbi:DUF6236 family protein [Kribbella pratensis]|uniref:Uncharacterized protein n=1 Tax=Kribbella pratensis TaxID=2512112 RepID=A0A4R8BXE9_9ACTN|nr:DUF6236 family protein [Kribbella pratensis]TDW66216.1 hypothetical protein EV653_6238 [Kribbella pratensis]
MRDAGLYFPFIHVRDDDWLKLAALYWPQLYRIAPQYYLTRDSDTAREFGDADVFRSVDPQHYLDGLTIDLVRAIEDNLEVLQSAYGLERANEAFDGTSIWSDGVGNTAQYPQLAWIHAKKFWPGLIKRLVDAGLAVQGRPQPAQHHDGDDGAWIGMHPALGGAYMTALAMQIGQLDGMLPLTDQAESRTSAPSADVAAVLHLLTGSARAARGEEVSSRYMMLALQYIRPKNLSAIPARRILECREALAPELQRFREHVEAAEAELEEVAALQTEQRRLDAVANHVQRSIEAPLRDLERGLQLNRIEPARAMLVSGSLAAPPIAGNLLDTSGLAGTVIGQSVGAALAVGAAWWQVGEARRVKREASPMSYVLAIQDELTPKTFAQKVRRVWTGTH